MPVFGSAFGAWNDALDPLTTDQAKAFLLSLLPPGFTRWFDFSDGSFGDLILEGAAEQFALTISAGAFEVGANSNPMTLMVTGLAAWEAALGLAATSIALGGDYAERLAQIISRLREVGACTVPNIRAVVQPFLQYDDPDEIEVVQCNRAALRTEHTRIDGTGIHIAGGGTVTQTQMVRDDAKVSKGGVQVLLFGWNATGGYDDITITLTGPDATAKEWTGGAPLISGSDPLYLYAPEFAGKDIFGEWELEVVKVANNLDSNDWELFVEGIGRDSTGRDGLGAAIFEYGVFVDPTKTGASAILDYDAIERAMARFRPGHTVGRVILGSSSVNPGDMPAIPDDDAAIPDRCIPG